MIPCVTPLAQQWHELLEGEPDDWSHLSLELRLDDTERTEEACTIACALNPWRRDDDYRSGILRFLVAHRDGYGAAVPLVRRRLELLDEAAIGGTLTLLHSLDAVRLVATQGPTL
jgi:hypothetical protein